MRSPHALHFFGSSFFPLCTLQRVPVKALLAQLLSSIPFLSLTLLRLRLEPEWIQVSILRQAEGTKWAEGCCPAMLCSLLLLTFQLGI